MTVVAFDIDGTLTRDEVLTAYRELQNRAELTIGIITARTKKSSKTFVEDNNLKPEFMKNRIVKYIAFQNIENKIDDDRYIYVGNRLTDSVFARASGWEFVIAYTVDNSESII